MFKDMVNLKFKKLGKFYVQICPVFARPVTYYNKLVSTYVGYFAIIISNS